MGCSVTFLFLQTGYTSADNYSGSLRLKYEYQHLVIKNIDLFLDETNRENISNSDMEFCFAEDVEENIMKEKQYEFIIQNNLLNNVEKEKIIKNTENINDRSENKYNKIINKQKIKKYLIENIVPFVNQEKNDVVISKKEEKIIFEGYGQQGISVNIETTINLIVFDTLLKIKTLS